jgi:hypothetical protein
MQMSQEFTKMMLGEDYEITEEMGDIEALLSYLLLYLPFQLFLFQVLSRLMLHT